MIQDSVDVFFYKHDIYFRIFMNDAYMTVVRSQGRPSNEVESITLRIMRQDRAEQNIEENKHDAF